MMDNKQIRELIESVIFDQPDDCSGWGSYERGQIDEARRIYRELMTKFPIEVKLAVVPWTESKIGDVVEIDCEDDGRHAVKVVSCDGLDWSERCAYCICGDFRQDWTCPFSENDRDVSLCETHPSGCDVYFTEAE